MIKSSEVICVMGALPDNPNKGCAALAIGSFNALSNIYPDSKFCIFNYFRKKPEKIKVGLKNRVIPADVIDMRFSKNVFKGNHILSLVFYALLIRIIPFSVVKKIVYRRIPQMEKISEVDVFFAVSGGDSFSDIYGIRRLLYVTLPMIFILFMKKRLVMLPQTYGPFNSFTGRLLSRHIIIRAWSIFSRDEESLRELKQRFISDKISKKIHLCSDMAFLVDPSKSVSGIGKGLIGLNLSGLLYHGGYNNNNQFNLLCDYRDLMARIVSWAVNDLNKGVLLIPHVFGDSRESDLSSSMEFLQGLPEDLKLHVNSLDKEYQPDELKCIIGETDFFIGSRMHSCIASISQARACVPIAYSKKFRGVMSDLNISEVVADPVKTDAHGIMDHIKDVYKRRETINTKLVESVKGIKTRIIEKIGENIDKQLDKSTPLS